MWKRTILVALCLVILFAYPVHAVEPRITVNLPTLEFSGTTALCEFRITNFGKSILTINVGGNQCTVTTSAELVSA